MKKIFRRKFPLYIISYLLFCGLLIGLTIFLLVLRFAFHIYTIEPYYLICILLGSTTLFCTVVVAVKDYKK